MTALFRQVAYQPLGADENEHQTRTEESQQDKQWPLPRQLRFPECLVLVNIFLTCAIVVVIGRSCYLLTRSVASICTPDTMSTCSPIFDRVPIHMETKTMINTFWPEQPPSIYQQLPSLEVDAAWDRISLQTGFPITYPEALALGKNPSALWPYPSNSSSSSTFIAQLDLTHEIHCLDLLRRFAFPNYYGDLRSKWRSNKFLPVEPHLLHCTYILLQSLMCHADLEVVTFNKLEGFRGPFPDFSVQRKCRNFDQILGWLEKDQMDAKDAELVQHTPDGIVEVAPEGRVIPLNSTD